MIGAVAKLLGVLAIHARMSTAPCASIVPLRLEACTRQRSALCTKRAHGHPRRACEQLDTALDAA